MDYLKTLAISRIYLDNIENIQSYWVTKGLKTCQIGLRFGGNDVGSIMIEENVVRAAGIGLGENENGLVAAFVKNYLHGGRLVQIWMDPELPVNMDAMLKLTENELN